MLDPDERLRPVDLGVDRAEVDFMVQGFGRRSGQSPGLEDELIDLKHLRELQRKLVGVCPRPRLDGPASALVMGTRDD